MSILDYVTVETSTKADGNMSYSHGKEEEVDKNRLEFWRRNGFKYDNSYLLRTDFEQRDTVKVVNDAPEEFTIVHNTDALITDSKEVVLALLTGDCLQITAFDPKQNIVSLIHAGFRWQDAGIIDKAFKTMKERFGTHPKDVLVHFGNCISGNNYRWDKNIFKNTRKDSWIRKCITKDDHPDRPYVIDMKKSAILNLQDIGVLEKNIYDTNIDCFTDRNYFSHVRSVYSDEPDGRHITVVQMK